MSGFGLYETLRLIIPGGLAVAAFSFLLRLATGEGNLLSKGRFEDVVAALHGTTFLFVSLVVGFLLYMVDVPSRARLSKHGDPDNGYTLPTTELREMIKGTPQEDRSFSLYFILSDGRLPPELHRRIYFFGGLYRVYFDARVVTSLAVAIGGPLALASAGEGSSPVIGANYLLAALAISVVAIVIVIVAESRHALESMRKDGRGRDPHIAHPSPVLRNAYLIRARRAIREMTPLALTICIIETSASFLADASPVWLRLLGVASAAVGCALWLMVEMGPPEGTGTGDNTTFAEPVRGRILGLFGLRPSTRTQYTQLQRGFVDVALFTPSLVACGVASQLQGRSPESVLLWSIFVLPAVLIMGIRKHEQRQLAAYKDQVNWLRVNEARIQKLANGGLADEWI